MNYSFAKKTDRTLNLRNSEIGSLPIVGYFFYAVQLLLLFVGFSNLYLSKKEKTFLPLVIKIVEIKFNKILCRTDQLGFILSYFSQPIHLHLLNPVDTKYQYDYESLMWTLFFSKKIEKDTLFFLKKHVTKQLDLVFKNKISRI